MSILTNMTKLPTNSTVISLLITVSTVLGCGVLPAGQESSRTFTVTGFTTLPVAMVYTSAVNAVRFPGIATSEASARGFVQRLVMQTVFDVLERQARSALLPDAVISAILDQLTVKVVYNPMNCPLVTGPEEMHNAVNMDEIYCIIVGNTVTGICTVKMNANRKCDMPVGAMVEITTINGTHLTISGNFLDHKYHHGKLVESDVARCSGQSCSNFGIGEVWIALSFSKSDCWWKLKSGYDMFRVKNR